MLKTSLESPQGNDAGTGSSSGPLVALNTRVNHAVIWGRESEFI